ncbi:hypothetical protein N7G274_006874 [Stereocaulon virgatum]|uniref:F-box domain-containing protein n=1 Tax=Stereocaulon virgatum TaxID=373712 RepID=A0ABR4A699_9LECA
MASLEVPRITGDVDGAKQTMALFDLPNEVLIHVLACLDTLALLQVRAVAHRFQNLIIRIVHARLLQAASLKDRKLILECYHPSAQYTEPYLHCDYLGTPGLSGDTAGQGSIYEIAEDHASEGTLQTLYSRFRPTRNDPQPTLFRSHPAGDIPGSRTMERAAARMIPQAEVVSQNVNLEAHEPFTQLRLLASLVQVGPRRGFFISIQNIVEKKTARIFRTWLAEMAERTVHDDAANSPASISPEEESVVWVDHNKIAGLRVRVKETRWRKDAPILIHRDEGQAISYSLELRELLISTTHLMLAVEKSLQDTETDSGRAMVFGSFATANT